MYGREGGFPVAFIDLEMLDRMNRGVWKLLKEYGELCKCLFVCYVCRAYGVYAAEVDGIRGEGKPQRS